MDHGPFFSWSVDLNFGFAAAAVLSMVTFGVHTFIGGKFVARPLLASIELPRASLWLNYFTWHMATVMLLFMSAGFAFAASRPDATDVAALLTLMAATFSPLCIWVAIKGGISPWRFPASWLFALIALVAFFGEARFSIREI
jgi:hypothetical protein